MKPELEDIPFEIEMAVREMPAISPVMTKINQISHEMDTSPRELVKIIMIDPVLTGKVIRLVNSSFYGLPRRIQSLAQAVVLLGVNTVKNLAISTALLSAVHVEEKNSPLPQREFWQHCLGTAIASRFLAKNLKTITVHPETFFIAGLLHDVGKILLVKTDPGKYKNVMDESRDKEVALAVTESVHFGFTHMQAGGVLARQWKLDDNLTSVIESHHSPPGKTADPLLGLVIIANNLCKRIQVGDSGNPVIEEMADRLSAGLGIKEASIIQITEKLPLELEKAVEFLDCMQGGGTPGR